MTVDEIQVRIKDIESRRDDDETAHSMEDSLWCDVLQAIADGHENPSEIARLALTTSKIDFARWCA